MCGIAGILDWRRSPADRLAPMLRVIRHRGPDDEGSFVAGPLAMGMRRLSIIDLSTGHQPIANEDGSVVVVFNGEIYNYLELREELVRRGHQFSTRTDTEMLVHMYEEQGPEFLSQLNGMFGFAIWDSARRRLFVARDRLGVKPMYYAATPGGVVFGSELKSLLATGLVQREVDPSALFDYLAYYYIPGEKTPFQGIHKLLPGHYFLADENGVTVRRWWNLADHTQPPSISKETARDRIRELFFDSVRLRMRSDVPVGSYLSGGLDSSLATAAAARQTELPFATFSVEFSESEFDELPYARAVAKHAGTNHHEVRVTPSNALERLPGLVWYMDEPNGDSAILPTYLVSQLASRHVKVVLSGIGADELFGGYHRYHAVLGKFERLAALPKWMLRLLQPLASSLKHEWGFKMARMLNPPPPWRAFMEKTHRFDAEVAGALLRRPTDALGERMRELFQQYPGTDFVNQRMFVDAHSYLPDQILALTDRMSMAVSIEARTPYLDYRLVEFATSLPGDWKVSGAEWKIIMKDALGDLVPERILKRPKWGFAAPIHGWMIGKHLESLVHLCRHSHMVRTGLFDGRAMERLLANPDTIKHDAEWLWALAILEIWFRVYIEGDGLVAPTANLVQFSRDS